MSRYKLLEGIGENSLSGAGTLSRVDLSWNRLGLATPKNQSPAKASVRFGRLDFELRGRMEFWHFFVAVFESWGGGGLVFLSVGENKTPFFVSEVDLQMLAEVLASNDKLFHLDISYNAIGTEASKLWIGGFSVAFNRPGLRYHRQRFALQQHPLRLSCGWQ